MAVGIGSMLAEHMDGEHDGEPHEEDGDGEVDHKKLAEAAVKAFFEAGKSGDYAMATEHLSAAMEHCENYEDEMGEPEGGESHDEGGGHHALLLIPHGKG